MNRRILSVVLWSMGWIGHGQSLPDPVDTPEWYASGSGEKRFLVRARHPETVQTLSVWVKRGVAGLENAWKQDIPFQKGTPLLILVDPGIESTSLQTSGTGDGVRQILRIPERGRRQDPRELADAFTRAMLHRLISRDLGPAQTIEANAIPDWLVAGNRHHVLSGESAARYHGLFRDGRLARVPPPEVVAATPASARDAVFEARAALVCRWLLERRRVGEQVRGVPWGAFARFPHDPDAMGVVAGPGGDLRRLHLEWDLWVEGEAAELITEFRLEDAALDRLESRLRFHPSTLGYRGERFRYQTVNLPELAEDLDAPGVSATLAAWTFELGELGFRQSGEFASLVGAYTAAAGKLIRAAESRGNRREKRLREFYDAWEAAEAAREAFRDARVLPDS